MSQTIEDSIVESPPRTSPDRWGGSTKTHISAAAGCNASSLEELYQASLSQRACDNPSSLQGQGPRPSHPIRHPTSRTVRPVPTRTPLNNTTVLLHQTHSLHTASDAFSPGLISSLLTTSPFSLQNASLHLESRSGRASGNSLHLQAFGTKPLNCRVAVPEFGFAGPAFLSTAQRQVPLSDTRRIDTIRSASSSLRELFIDVTL